ncbi:unnamed protein product [Cylicostephanus goldi]|uniref:Uncharacterized protein n=1 Tax=Cylicostephanus goldi TaxID=71465 RepID=A0A3P6SCP8_CYLGO|nr:unnamed protein product [Cylicostephanus goldi]
MDCRENLQTTITNTEYRGPLTSTPVLSKHNDNDFFNIDISTVVPDASYKYELPVKPLDSVYANPDNCYNPLLVKEEPYTDGIVNQFSKKPIRSSEATEQPEIENIHEFNISLDRTLHGSVEAENTEVECHANEATHKRRMYDGIAADSSKLGNVESHREAHLTRKSPMTPQKVILDLDTHEGLLEAVTGHEIVADEKLTSNARSPCSNHAPAASAGRNSGRKNRMDPKDLQTQHTTKHNSTVTDNLGEEERAIQCQIPVTQFSDFLKH